VPLDSKGTRRLHRHISRLRRHRMVVHRGHRRFVRDGEVPVTILHHEHNEGCGTNKLDEARKALQDQIAACEHAERQLQEAQAAIENLQTHLAHERIAAHEATQKAEAAGLEIEQTLQATREELDAERHAHQQAKQQRDQAVAGACRLSAIDAQAFTMMRRKANPRRSGWLRRLHCIRH
jgi:hypothetical protein